MADGFMHRKRNKWNPRFNPTWRRSVTQTRRWKEAGWYTNTGLCSSAWRAAIVDSSSTLPGNGPPLIAKGVVLFSMPSRVEGTIFNKEKRRMTSAAFPLVLGGSLAGVGLGAFLAGSVWCLLIPPKFRSAAMGHADAPDGDTTPVRFRQREPPYRTVVARCPSNGVVYPKGFQKSVVVWYDPVNPTNGTLTRPALINSAGAALALVGLLLTVLGCGYYIRTVTKQRGGIPSP